MTWALRHAALPPGRTLDRAVLLVLAWHAWNGGDEEGPELSYPALDTLVLETGISRRRVQLALAALQADGLIVKVPDAPGVRHKRGGNRPWAWSMVYARSKACSERGCELCHGCVVCTGRAGRARRAPLPAPPRRTTTAARGARRAR